MVDFLNLGGYLSPVDPDLWVWDDKGETVQWASGTTVGFREEFEAILARLESNALGSDWFPPFGALVLLVAACRGEPAGWGRVDPGSSAAHANPEMTALANHLRRVGFRGNAYSLLHGLEKIHRFPPNCRAPLKAKTELAVELFEGSTLRTRPAPGAGFLSSLRRRDFQPALAHHALAALEQGLARFDAADWPTRFDTGVDDVPEPTDVIELPESAPRNAETVRRLLETLRQDQELAALASVARDLLAVAHLPRPVAAREDLPIGGVSDISNRGSLQHLLVAELANDDFTLALRVAQGEALYLRREDPPSPPPGDRVLVLDSGLRMWGTPRVFAASVGLALAATTANNGEWKAFRAEGEAAVELDLTSREGVLDHLGRLSPALSPIGALEKVYQDAAARSVREVVLITSEEAAADPAFAAQLPTGRGPNLYVASVGRTGEFRLREPRKRGLEPIRDAKFDVSALVTARKSPTVAPASGRLPPIFAARPFPLLLPAQFPEHGVVLHPSGGVVGILGGGRLMHWPDPQWGGVELAANTGAGHVRCLAVFPDGTVSVLRYASGDQPTRLYTFPPGGEPIERDLGLYAGPPPQAFRRGATLFLVADQKITAVDPWTGRVIARRLLEKSTVVRKFRFFRDHGRWVYPTVEHERLTLAPVFDEEDDKRYDGAVDLFEQPGTEEVWAVMADGTLTPVLEPHRAVRFDVPPPVLGLAAVSAGGRYLEVTALYGRYLLDLESRTARSNKHDPIPLDVPRPVTFSYRTRIQGVGFDASGKLVLAVPSGGITTDGGWHAMQWREAESSPRMHPFPGAPDDPPTPPEGLLRRVSLSGPREAILDKRGLLHLFDASGVLPDVTLTLFWGEANAAWSSRLGSVGNPYCFGDRIPYPNEWKPFLEAVARYGEGL